MVCAMGASNLELHQVRLRPLSEYDPCQGRSPFGWRCSNHSPTPNPCMRSHTWITVLRAAALGSAFATEVPRVVVVTAARHTRRLSMPPAAMGVVKRSRHSVGLSLERRGWPRRTGEMQYVGSQPRASTAPGPPSRAVRGLTRAGAHVWCEFGCGLILIAGVSNLSNRRRVNEPPSFTGVSHRAPGGSHFAAPCNAVHNSCPCP